MRMTSDGIEVSSNTMCIRSWLSMRKAQAQFQADNSELLKLSTSSNSDATGVNEADNEH